MKKKQMWGFVVSSLFIMTLANVPIVFSDESQSQSVDVQALDSLGSELLERSSIYKDVNESDFSGSELEATTESAPLETSSNVETTDTTDATLSETIDSSTSDDETTASSEEKALLRVATVASEKLIGQYTTIVSKDLVLWKEPIMQTQVAISSKYFQQTLYVDKEVTLSDGTKLYALQNNQKQFLGYIKATGIKLVSGQQGSFQSINQYVTVKGTYTIWNNFDWVERASATKYQNQTLHAKGIYYHFNGSRYLSLYNNKNQWIGYINQNGVRTGSGQQGAFHSISRYVSIKGTYTIWNNFKWEKRASATQYKNQTFQAKGIYYHFNGSRYLSLYNNQGKWVGYINESGVTTAKGQQGIYHGYGRYISVIGNYDFWRNFSWSSRVHSSKYQGQTFLAKGIYYHFNGSRYLSVYDNKGNWMGYLNAAGAKVVSGQQGAYQNYGKNVTIKTNSYAIWRNFSWSSKASGSHLGKTYLAKGVYHHFNGSRYLSLYDSSNRWIGYINSLGTNDSYGNWAQRGDKWYYLTRTGQVTKGWAKIDQRWHYFDGNGVNIDTDQARFISRNINDVLTITNKHQLYPSIMLAQAILESNYGTSELALKANNFFGMKFKENEDEGKYDKYFVETKEYDPVTGEMVTIRAAFRKYPTRLASFEDNALKLRLGVSWDKNYYSGTWRENAASYKEVSKALTGRYATDPNYGQKLNIRIETW